MGIEKFKESVGCHYAMRRLSL